MLGAQDAEGAAIVAFELSGTPQHAMGYRAAGYGHRGQQRALVIAESVDARLNDVLEGHVGKRGIRVIRELYVARELFDE